MQIHLLKKSLKALQIALMVFCVGVLVNPLLAQKIEYTTVEEVLSSYFIPGGSGPNNVQWIEGGKRYSYDSGVAFNERNISIYNPKDGSDQLVYEGGKVTFPNSVDYFYYRSFEWTNDSKNIVFQTKFRPIYRNSGVSDYYQYTIADQSLTLIAKDANTAQVSPNGLKVGMERKGNMFVYDLATKEETQLTDDAEESLYNGRYGWAYEEEFGLVQAWKWSHDSQYLAYWQIDEREVPIFQMTDYEGRHPTWETLPYPKVGDKNPIAKIGVIDVETGAKKWMNLDIDGGYIPRIYWTSKKGQLAVTWMNRAQTHMKLYFFDVKTGEGRLIMEDKADRWIDMYDFFAGILDYFVFPEESESFFWVSDRDGFNHIYRYDYDGKLLNQVTKGDWEVTIINSIDAKGKSVYYTSTEEHPTQRHLYRIDSNGKKKTKLTKERGNHSLNVSPSGEFYIDTWSNTNTPSRAELWSTKGKGKFIKQYESDFLDEYENFRETNHYTEKELFSFTTSDGQELDGWILKPEGFGTADKHPLYLSIYGGPGAQSVYDSFHSSGFEQFLVQQGFVVASVNNRGSGGYGRDFKKMVYKKLGEWEAFDFAETAKYLAREMHVDENKMAIRGHSYGGFMTITTMFTQPGVFQVGLCGAPVTDWRLYDSIYAERYMGLLEDNKEGYDARSTMNQVEGFEGKMLLAHSGRDENVHMQNTMQLMTAAASAGKDIDLRIYPPGAHGVAFNRASRYLLYTTYYDYLKTYLLN
jgi:dipeptidyl-peptidase-4